MSRLKPSISVCRSSFTDHTQGSAEVQSFMSQDDPPVQPPLLQPATQTRSPDPAARQSASPELSINELSSMDPEQHLQLPPDCMEVLKEARRPSTRRSYTFKWK